MSRINAGLYSSSADDWMTPPDFIETLLKFLGKDRFDLDPCCTLPNIPALRHYFYPDYNGLLEPWGAENGSVVYLNPPYGTALPKWILKASEEAKRGAQVWGLIPARPDTRYWQQQVFSQHSFVFFLQGRLKFLKNGVNNGTAPFPTALVYWGKDWPAMADRFSQAQPFKGSLVITAY